jgi:hypothetical protein
MFHKRERIGTIVQRLSNKIDGGSVLALGYSKAFHHSYKKTALNFYANSKYLLRNAVVNYSNARVVEVASDGKNFTLPSNGVVIRFLAALYCRSLARLLYGAFYEKRWNVVKFRLASLQLPPRLRVQDGFVPPVASGYSFYADPFFSSRGDKIRVEALNNATGLGEIIELDAGSLSKLDSPEGQTFLVSVLVPRLDERVPYSRSCVAFFPVFRPRSF